ncbi:MAG: radical SAM/SPASM domain-containing protein [Phycisphaeraceae bacterium]
MTTLSTHIERQLARTTTLTGRWKETAAQAPALFKRALTGIDFFARGVFHVYRNHRYLTLAKLANMALVNLQYRLKTERVIGRPVSMKIESTNICNTSCQLCPTGQGLVGRPKGKMSFEQFTGLIDKLKWHLVSLDLSMWGDPLIVPDIYRMTRYAHDRGVWTYLSSNLHAFRIEPKRGETKDQATQLVESGLDLLTCSLHGAGQTSYETYQPGKKFEDAVAKIRHLIATRDRMGSRTPQVQLNFVVTKHNEHEIERFQKLADELGCKAIFSPAAMNLRFLSRDQKLQPLGLAEDVLAKKVKDRLAKWLPENERYILPPYREIAKTGRLRGPEFNGRKPMDCSWPWKSSVINWDGQVVACCGSFAPEEDLGSVFEEGFARIWNGRRYRLARRSFRKQLSAEDAADSPCATCPGFML